MRAMACGRSQLARNDFMIHEKRRIESSTDSCKSQKIIRVEDRMTDPKRYVWARHFQCSGEARCDNYRFSFNYLSFACSPLSRYSATLLGSPKAMGMPTLQQSTLCGKAKRATSNHTLPIVRIGWTKLDRDHLDDD